MTECLICYEPLLEETTLVCGHRFHSQCIQKSGDALQETRVENGYPPLKYCPCPLCRTPLVNYIAKTIPVCMTDDQYNIDSKTLLEIIDQWTVMNDDSPLSFYFWIELCEKYPTVSKETEFLEYAQDLAAKILRA